MRWLRDNWIDALIFTVFAITVVGIVLFLTGVNPFSPKGPIVAPGAAATEKTATEPVISEPVATNESPTTAKPAAEEAEAPAVTVVPLLPGSQEAKPTTSGEGRSTAAKPSSGEKSSSSSRPATSNKPSSAVKLPGGPEEGVFRVSVGAFSNPNNALALAQKLQKQGFPVRLEPVGKVTRVVVGPYPTRSQAAAAARKLSSYDPQVYRGDTPVPEGVYLQVGAYKKLSSAAGLVAKLRAAGIGPIVFYYQEPWLKVWVGPVSPEKVGDYKRKLQELGLQVVEVH